MEGQSFFERMIKLLEAIAGPDLVAKIDAPAIEVPAPQSTGDQCSECGLYHDSYQESDSRSRWCGVRTSADVIEIKKPTARFGLDCPECGRNHAQDNTRPCGTTVIGELERTEKEEGERDAGERQLTERLSKSATALQDSIDAAGEGEQANVEQP